LSFLALNCNNDNSFNVYFPPDNSSLNVGLIAYYPFNGNSRDCSGNYRDGIAHNSYFYVNGVSNMAIYLVGTDSVYSSSGGYVEIPPLDTAGLNSLSICIWVKEDTMYIPDGGQAYVQFGTDGTLGWCGIVHYQSSIEFAVGAETNGFNPQSINPISLTYSPYDSHRWVFYCLTYKNGVLSAYKNGAFLTSINQKLMIYGKAGFIAFDEWGGPYAGYSTRFSGAIDELRIYKRALSREEILQLYNLK
jgi:Concanavalin A-like lectin/glucanases superfamily